MKACHLASKLVESGKNPVGNSVESITKKAT